MKTFWQGLSKRERRLVLATLLVVAVFAAKYLLITPLMERREWTRNQLESQPQLLAKNLRYLSQKDSMRVSLEALRTQAKAFEAKLLTGDTPSVSASDLQETVQGLATREGTQVITTRVLNPEPAGTLSKIGIQMEVGAQIQQIANLVRALESSPKLLVIEEITIRSLFRPLGFAQPPGSPQMPAQNLRVSFTVGGFARATANTTSPKSANPG